MKHFENGERAVDWDMAATKLGKLTSGAGWIGYSIFVKKRELNKCTTEACSHLTPNEYCKTCTRLLNADLMLHPNLCWPDHGGGVSRWLDDDSDDVRTQGGGATQTPHQLV